MAAPDVWIKRWGSIVKSSSTWLFDGCLRVAPLDDYVPEVCAWIDAFRAADNATFAGQSV